MRVTQQPAKRGSQKWMQDLVDRHPGSLDGQLRASGALTGGSSLTWRSPLKGDDWAEYRDEDFLNCLGLKGLSTDLAAYWPRRGPQWDALATGADGRVFLVEAKAHAHELESHCQALPESRNVIADALNRTKKSLGVSPEADWLTGYYQYANRLAHLQFLRNKGVDAWLIFLYFTSADDVNGPASAEEWRSYQQSLYRHLGLWNAKAIPGVVNAYVDVQSLR